MIASARKLALAATAVGALHAPYTTAKADTHFVFTDLTHPNHKPGRAQLTGIYQNQAVGFYETSSGNRVAFVWSAGTYTVFSNISQFSALSDNGLALTQLSNFPNTYTTYNLVTGITNTYDLGPTGGTLLSSGINSSSAIVATRVITTQKHNGLYKSVCRPFEQNVDGSYAWLSRSATDDEKLIFTFGLLDDGTAVMYKGGYCGNFNHKTVIIEKNGDKRALSFPNADDIGVDFVNGVKFGGSYHDTASGSLVLFTSEGGKATSYTGPTTVYNQGLTGAGPYGEVAGWFYDTSGRMRGFIYRNKKYYTIDYPHSKATMITGFSSTGAIIGYRGSGPEALYYPFIATCGSDKGCTE